MAVPDVDLGCGEKVEKVERMSSGLSCVSRL